MWFNRGLFQRLEQLKAQHIENSEFTAKELNSVRKRILTLEKQVVDAMNREEEWKRRLAKIENDVGTLGLKERRITTLEQQVNDLMNENVDLISQIRAIEKKITPKEKELKIYRDEERGGYVLKEVDDWKLLPRVGDLVANIEQENDIRRVFENHYGFMFVGKDYRTVYARNQLKDSLKEWKVIARKEDLK